jgi:hypothetical protein
MNNSLAKTAAAAPFANFANNRCESSLTPLMIHTECAENEDLFCQFRQLANGYQRLSLPMLLMWG